MVTVVDDLLESLSAMEAPRHVKRQTEGGGGGPGLPPELQNLDLSEDQGPRTLAVIWSLLGLSAIFLVARVWVKFGRHRGLWWDDHALMASWFTLLVHTAATTVMVREGYGKHVTALDPSIAPRMTTLGFVSFVFVVAAIAWSKTSFGITLLRIAHGWVKVAIWIIIITMNILLALAPIVHVVSCKPVEKFFNAVLPGECWDPNTLLAYDIFCSGYSAAMDLVLAAIPIFLIKDIQMKKTEKVGVAVAMSMGVFAGATAIVKCTHLPTVLEIDFSYKGVELSIWGSAEAATTIVAASIPVLRVFVRDVHSSVGRYYGRNTHGGTAQDMDGTRMSRINRGNNTAVVATIHDVERAVNLDDSSDRSILGPGKIMQTREINVETQSRTDVDDMGYGLGKLSKPEALRRDFEPRN